MAGRKAKTKYRVGVIDYETDPFLYNRVPEPFVVEFFNGDDKAVFWGEDCSRQLIDYLDDLNEPHILYAHNGGKFDFHFLHARIEDPCLIIKSRIVEATLGKHKLRDSFAIMPFPLKNFEKMEFDYNKMERPVREKNKAEILEYLHSDCESLYKLVAAFNVRFGPRLTIGGTAMKEIKKIHDVPNCGSGHDAMFRRFYFGGRVETFKSGILPGPWKLHDVNSMYPSAMRNKRHPIGGAFAMYSSMPDTFDEPFFMEFTGKNHGALPSYQEGGGLTFRKKEGRFFACSHEIEIALEHELIEIEQIHNCYVSTRSITFKEFVDTFYKEKADAKAAGDYINEIFAKYILNSGYGRFGINPENFEEYLINRDFGNDRELEARGYSLQVEYEEFELWCKKADVTEDQFADVAIAASITSAARSILLEGLQAAIDPIYCDTDSIICREFNGDIDKYRLGAWDLEKTADNAAIAGKKLYALYNGDSELVKLSSKGGSLSLEEVKAVARGERVRFDNQAPTFSLRRAPSFVSRTFANTAITLEMAETEE